MVQANAKPHASADPSAVDQLYDAFIERLSPKGRAVIRKHDELIDADATQSDNSFWKRLAGRLSSLAPFPAETIGPQSVRFYIPDGKFRQQVFALEDNKGTLVIYLPDVIALATARKILGDASDSHYPLVGHAGAQISLDLITADTRDMPLCKPMLGWGRRALRATLSPAAAETQCRIIERLCSLAAESWATTAQYAAPTARTAS